MGYGLLSAMVLAMGGLICPRLWLRGYTVPPIPPVPVIIDIPSRHCKLASAVAVVSRVRVRLPRAGPLRGRRPWFDRGAAGAGDWSDCGDRLGHWGDSGGKTKTANYQHLTDYLYNI